MRDAEECRYEIIKLFKEWKERNHPDSDLVSANDAIVFFAELRSDNSKWLEFRYHGDKWQQVHSWLVQERLTD